MQTVVLILRVKQNEFVVSATFQKHQEHRCENKKHAGARSGS